MRSIRLVGFLVLLCSLSLPAAAGVRRASSPPPPAPNGEVGRATKSRETSLYLPDRVIVKLRSSASSSKAAQTFGAPALDAFVARYGTQSVSRMFPARTAPLKKGDLPEPTPAAASTNAPAAPTNAPSAPAAK